MKELFRQKSHGSPKPTVEGICRKRSASVVLWAGSTCVLVLVGVLLCGVLERCVTRLSAEDVTGGTHVGQVWETMRDGKSVEEAMEQEGFIYLAGKDLAHDDSERPDALNRLPAWFEEEIADPTRYEACILNEDTCLVGLIAKGSCEESMHDLRASLEARDWIAVSSGGEGPLTFIKEKGVCRWLLLQGIQTQDETSIVLHIQQR